MLDTADIAAPIEDGAVAPDTLKRRQILDGARRVFLAKGFDEFAVLMPNIGRPAHSPRSIEDLIAMDLQQR